jgi:chromosome segregation ATPase
VANEKLNKDRTMLSRALERGAHERAEMSAGCNKMKADMEKVETRAAALHKELSDAKNILMVLDERFEKTDSNVRSALEQKKRMSQRIADLKCQLVECKEASDKVAIELQKSQVEQVSTRTLGGIRSMSRHGLTPAAFPRRRPRCRSRWSRCAARPTCS